MAKAGKPKLPALFFLNGNLHRRQFINRGKDMVTTWNYPERKKMVYVYTDVLRRFEPAFTTNEVAKMVGRGRLALDRALRDGMIERPQMTYGLDEKQNPYAFMWNEKDIMDLLEFLSTVHIGRPRKDGVVNPGYLPTPREVRAMIRGEGEVLYVKGENGFVPTWRAKDM